MKNPEYSVDIAAYLIGDALDPDVITKELGKTPSVSRRKGKRQYTKDGITREYKQPKGVWSLEATTESGSVSSGLLQLLGKLGNMKKIINEVPEIEFAFIDILFTCSPTSVDDDSLCFELSADDIRMIGDIGLSVKCTVCFVRE